MCVCVCVCVCVSSPDRWPSAPCWLPALRRLWLPDSGTSSTLPLGLKPDSVLPHHKMSTEEGMVDYNATRDDIKFIKISQTWFCCTQMQLCYCLSAPESPWSWTTRPWTLGRKSTAPRWYSLWSMSGGRCLLCAASDIMLSGLRLSVDWTYVVVVCTVHSDHCSHVTFHLI